MSYNGSGTFNINTSGQPVVTGTVISSTAFNALTADLGTGLSTAITKDGQTVATARIPFAAGINSSLVTDATSTTTGSIITAGGVGIAKALFVGTTANIAGTTTLTGVTATSITDSGLTSGRVTYAGTAGLLQDSANLTFSGSALAVTGTLSATGTLSGGTSGTGYSFSGSAAAGSLTLDSSGNLGIGTSSPGQKLDVVGSASAVLIKDTQAYSFGTSGPKVFLQGLDSSSTNTTLAYLQASPQNGNADRGFLNVYTRVNGVNTQTLQVGTGLTSDVIVSSGNLGLGVTPTAWTAGGKIIELGFKGNILYGVTYTAVGFSNNAYYDATAPSGWKFANPTSSRAGYYEQSQGTHVWVTSTAAGTAGNAITWTQPMTLDASGNLGIGTTSPARKLDVSGTGTLGSVYQIRATNGSQGVNLGANSTAADIQSTGSVPLYLNYGGNDVVTGFSGSNLLVGTTGLDGRFRVEVGSANWARVTNHTNGGTQYFDSFRYNGTEIGSITGNNTITTYNSTSDYRLKTVIGAVTDSGSRIDALQPVEYTWNSNGSRTRGFLAHEFQEVYENSVTGTKDAVDEDGKPVYQAMQAATSEVIADLVAELQSLRKRITALEALRA